MTYRGHYRNGIVVFDERPAFAEGASVEVMASPSTIEAAVVAPELPSWGEVFNEFVGQVRDLPADMADNHDHYIHGTRKR